MISYVKIIMLCLPLLLIGPSIFTFRIAESSTPSTPSTEQLVQFRDNVTGFSLQYPSTWQPLSEDYTRVVFGGALAQGEGSNNDILANLTRPILALFPKSPTGANLVIMHQILPFPLSAESFMNSSLLLLSEDPNIDISNTAPVSVGDSKGFKVNLEDKANNTKMSQIYLTKGGRGYVIQFVEGQNELPKSIQDINNIINSIKLG